MGLCSGRLSEPWCDSQTRHRILSCSLPCQILGGKKSGMRWSFANVLFPLRVITITIISCRGGRMVNAIWPSTDIFLKSTTLTVAGSAVKSILTTGFDDGGNFERSRRTFAICCCKVLTTIESPSILSLSVRRECLGSLRASGACCQVDRADTY